VSRQAEIVVGAEHDDALAIDDRLGAFVRVQRLVEGIEAKRLGLPDEREGARFAEDITTRVVVVAVEGKSVN
jgi:hypothetical protein